MARAAGTRYGPIGADVGDTLLFRFARGAHAVVALPDEASFATCSRGAFRSLAGPQDSPFRFVVPAPGVYYFACPVDTHCERDDMKVRVVANAP